MSKTQLPTLAYLLHAFFCDWLESSEMHPAAR